MYITMFENDIFGFTLTKHDELPSVEISDDNYNEFFERQSSGKSQRVKDINGTAFDEIFEEFFPESPREVHETPAEIEELQNENKTLKEELEAIKNILIQNKLMPDIKEKE